MIRFFLLIALLAIAVVVQTALADLAAVGEAKPDLLMALAIYFALTFDLGQVMIPIWALGAARDVFSIGPIGLYAFIFLAVGLMVSRVRAYAFSDNPVTVVVTVVIAVILSEFSAGVALSVRYAMPVAAGTIIGRGLISGLYCSLIVLLFSRVLARPCLWAGLREQ
jgi:rod shape-determining protein MreD